ncbi:MAG: DUF4263 domain-containing protein [Planctomycetaceae bacterium]|nr:DUF4263 domain-containing protein [Planctomycetaceae bacterium]
MNLDGEKPAEILETGEAFEALDDGKAALVRAVGQTVKAYLIASETLVQTRYSHLKEFAPTYLVSPGRAIAFCSADGVVIRYESRVNEFAVGGTWNDENLASSVKFLSQNVVRLLSPGQSRERTDADGVELTLSSDNPVTGEHKTIVRTRLLIDVEPTTPEAALSSPRKPFRLASIRSEVSFFLQGELIGGKTIRDQPFISHSRMKIPVGWDCIEIYPTTDLKQWDPDYAEIWAERDLLASVAALQHQESQLSELDPSAAARRKFAAEMDEFKVILDSNPEREEELHQFLKSKPHLLCPTKVAMWSKLSFGARASDFVFREATGEYLLVEIERSTLPLFIKSGDQSADLNHACSQITDWKRYIEDNLKTVQSELGLVGITANPNSLVVIGRSSTLTEENRRKLVALQKEVPTRRIYTYDDVYDNARAVLENLLGPLVGVGGNARTYYIPEGFVLTRENPQ